MSRYNTPCYTYQTTNPQPAYGYPYLVSQAPDHGRYAAITMGHNPSQGSDSSHGSYGYSSNTMAGTIHQSSQNYTYAPLSSTTRYQPNSSDYYSHASNATSTPRSHHPASMRHQQHPTSSHQAHRSLPPETSPAPRRSHHQPASSTDPKPKPYPCLFPDCPRTFARSFDLNRHYKTHQQEPKRYDCEYGWWCGRQGSKGFTREDHLKDHIRRVHLGGMERVRGDGR